MIIISPSFSDGSAIPRKFSGDGGDINPELQIQNVPPDAESLVLVVYDPDAPVRGGFYHWLVWDIDPGTSLIKEESVPPGAIEGVNGAGHLGYMGPKPPSGIHHYHFTLYALDARLDLPEGMGPEALFDAMEGRIIAKAELVGLYASEEGM